MEYNETFHDTLSASRDSRALRFQTSIDERIMTSYHDMILYSSPEYEIILQTLGMD